MTYTVSYSQTPQPTDLFNLLCSIPSHSQRSLLRCHPRSSNLFFSIRYASTIQIETVIFR